MSVRKPSFSALARRRTLRGADGIVAAFTMIVALQTLMLTAIPLAGLDDARPVHFYAAALFLLLALSQIIKMMICTRADRRRFLFYLAFALVFAALAAAQFLDRFSQTGVVLSGVFFCLYLLGRRILSVLDDRRWRNIIFSVLYCLVVVMLGLFFPGINDPGLVPIGQLMLLLMIVIKAFIDILIMSFSDIRLGILQKIIRKTFAVEILFGMLLLVFSFSYIFYMVEPDMETYGDALWYCFALVTTIGFGDMIATSPSTRVLSVIIGFYGIIVVALITSIIVNFYTEVKNDKDEDDPEPENAADAAGSAADAARNAGDAAKNAAAGTAAGAPENGTGTAE